MKPTFALNLSNERVGLLHRTGRGWMQVGDVAFDTPDLSEALAYLRKTALGLSPRGVSTKLVIPNSEILYCDVEAPGPDDQTRRKQIRAGLAGRTPYAPDDLVFDWRGKGTMVKVAVVARETLAEAEAFAVEHRFGPVSFVALPEPSHFKGEPFFGETEAAKTILSKGETVEPDRDAMTIVTRDLPLADIPPEPEERPAKRSERTENHSSDPIAGAVEKLRAASHADLQPGHAPEPVKADPDPAPSEPMVADANDAAVPGAGVPIAAPPEKPSRVADAIATPIMEKAASIATPVIDEAPFAEVVETSVATKSLKTAVLDDMPPAPSAAAQMAFNSRRETEDSPRQSPFESRSETGRPVGDLPGAGRADPVAKRSVPPLRSDAQVTAPSIPGSKKRKSGPTAPPPAVAAAAAALANSGTSLGKPTKPLTRPGGTFGAKPLPKRGKPRYLGWILTGLLLVALALVAAWSSYSLVQNESSLPNDTSALPASDDAGTTIAAVPAIEDEMLADQQDVTAFSDADSTAVPETSTPHTAGTAVATATGQADAAAGTGVVGAIKGSVAADTVSIADETAANDQQTNLEESIAPEPMPAEPASTDVVAASVPVLDPAAANGASVPALSETATPASEADLVIAGSETGAERTEPLPPSGDAVVVAAPPPAATPEPAPAPDLGIATNAAGPEPRVAVVTSDEVFLATADTAPSFQDLVELPDPAFAADPLPSASPPPPPFGTVYKFDAAGLIVPTVEGIMAPDGYMLFAGAPPLTPPERSAAAIAAAAAAGPPSPVDNADPEAQALAATAAASLAAPTEPAQAAPADPGLAGFRPRPRPADLTVPPATESADDANLSPETDTRVALIRPLARPQTVEVSGSAAPAEVAAATPRARPETLVPAGSSARDATSAASLTAQANSAVEAALASAAETGNIMTLAVSRRPAARPQDMSRAVNAAVAAAVRTPEPEAEVASSNNSALPEDDAEPEVASAAPKIPTKATVAKQATFANAINLSKINLIGVYGTPSKRYALIRLASGRYKKVSVGDTVDGGRVEAITASEVRYQKSGRLVSLKMPRA